VGMVLIGCWVQWRAGAVTIQPALAIYRDVRR